MKYKGAYSDSVSYNIGEVVVFTDGIPYYLQNPAPVGTGCHDTAYWQPLGEEMRDAVIMFHDYLASTLADLTGTKEVVDSMLFDDKTIILKSSTESSDKVYAITVDDYDGLAATEIEEEAADGEGGDT